MTGFSAKRVPLIMGKLKTKSFPNSKAFSWELQFGFGLSAKVFGAVSLHSQANPLNLLVYLRCKSQQAQ
jgi:hypothetical protein